MHGVGGATLLAAFERAGFPAPFVVPNNNSPIPRSRRSRSRTPKNRAPWICCWPRRPRSRPPSPCATTPTPTGSGAAIPTPEGGWRRLQGDEIGWLLADHILRHTTGDDRLVITTLVSSSLLGEDGGGVTACTSPRPTPVSSGSVTRSSASRTALRVRLRAGSRLSGRAIVRSTRTASPRQCCWPRSPRSRAPKV